VDKPEEVESKVTQSPPPGFMKDVTPLISTPGGLRT
jgi:hypothetical protein